jgi:DNA-binding NarL/FixJ family response regulator
MRKLRILLVDDHVVMREGLRSLINREPDMIVVGEATDGDEAIQLMASAAPEVAVLDLAMRRIGGQETARQMKKICPEIKLLGLTMHEDVEHVRDMVEAGAAGYVVKRAAANELIHAIRAVAEGGTYVDPRVAGELLRFLAPSSQAPAKNQALSERENDVLRLLAQGFSNRGIAARLNLSVKTVETYKERGMGKLGLQNRVDLMQNAAASGWLPAEPV